MSSPTPPAPTEPMLPAYEGAWTGGVLAALEHEAAWLPATALGADTVVLLVLDGLGWSAVEAHGDLLPTVRAMAGGPVTTCAPTTTAAALTSITTGRPPAEHGVVGYRFRVSGSDLNVLRWPAKRGPDPERVQPHAPFGGRAVPVVSRAEFAGSGFTGAHLRGADYRSWRTASGLVEHCRLLVRESGHELVYAYYDGVDKVAHGHGLRDGFYRAELAATDELVAALLEVLPASWALVVTADHGQVHVGAEGMRELDAVRSLFAAASGEGRFRWLHARPGARGELRAAAREAYGDVAWVRSRDEVLAEGWLGPTGAGDLPARLGDVLLAAREPVAFVDPAYTRERELVSCHGSLTREEMLVPLLAARGAA